MQSYCIVLVILIVSLVISAAQTLVSKCSETQFRCNDGSCIDSQLKCNGAVNCPDESDEDFVICRTNECKDDQFQCVYGACVRGNATCDGVKDCVDNSDELLLKCRNETTYASCIDEVIKNIACSFNKKCSRHKSTTSSRNDYMQECERKERSCKDGQLIEVKQRCDGTVHCKDGSDETLKACATNRCFKFEFRCKYGACVESSAKCNGVQNCADGSDELDDLCHVNNKGLCVLPPFPKNGFYSVADLPYAHPEQTFESVHLNYSCHSGYKLVGNPSPSCTRGYWSHSLPECVSQCSLKKHPSVAYLCLPKNSSSQIGAKECDDFVEEGMEVRPKCREPSYHYSGVLVNMHCTGGKWDHIIVCSPLNEGLCSLPPFPNNGYYIAADLPNAHPGQVFQSVYLNYTCHSGYKLVGVQSLYCSKGWWADKAPECISQCLLHKHASVEYLCLPKNSSSLYGAQECGELVEDGTAVRPTCRDNYYYTGALGNMHCTDGAWDHVHICSPQCGLVTSEGEQMVLGGRSAKRGELPWHAGIYTKTSKPYKQICGGSLISSTVIISAAHCFWSELEKQLPASDFAVAIGKIYRPWNNPQDVDAQKSDVREVKIPSRFQGATSNFQDDIAVVILKLSIEFRTYVRPVCIDFDPTFSRRQLSVGSAGKVAGWGLTAEDGDFASVLQVVELPYVDIEPCISASPPSFYVFITSDKFCAGVVNDLDLILTYHCCERSLQVSKQVLDLHLTLRSMDSFAVFFRDRSFDKKTEFALNTILYAMLPTPTVFGYQAVYLRLLDPDARNFFFNEGVRTFMMMFDLYQYKEGTWPGFSVIIDMDQTTMSHIGKLEIMSIKKVLYFVQECMLIKLKEVHFRNAPSFMDKLMMLLKPFLSKALLDIIYIHPAGDSIYKYIPKNSFPKEDGGTYKTREAIKAETIEQIQAGSAFYQQENRKRVVESLRPGGKTKVQNLFGIQGSFKKLELD